MAMTVNNSTNGTSMRELHGVNRQVRTSMERLTSGFRINDAADDAAGLAVAQLMSSETVAQSQAIRNASDGMSMTRLADGAMGQISDNLVKMRELATQAASDTLSDEQKSLAAMEFNALASENGRIAETTEFNGQKLLASSDGVDVHLGTAGDGGSQSITVPASDLTDLGTMTLDMDDPSATLSELDAATDKVASARAEVGATQNRLTSAVENMEIAKENTTAAQSRIMDADFAVETATMTRNMVLQQAGIAMQTQANMQAGQVVSLLG